jgi:hypothetical protein
VNFQAIPTVGAFGWEHFVIGSDHYLAVANYSSDSSRTVDSKIYQWNGSSFVEFQIILTIGARDWEHFSIGSDHYLVVANCQNNSTPNIDSKLYWWNGASFAEIQSIPTHGAQDWEYFTIGSDHYLAITNANNGSTVNIDSEIYRWDGTSLVELQSISTNGAHNWEYFTIGGGHYLAVANESDGSTYNIDSKIYRDPYYAYLPLIIKPEPLTYLYVKSTDTGGINPVEIRDPNDGNRLLLSCIVGNNVTTYCGSFSAVGTYRIIAYTANCGVLQEVFDDATAGATVTRKVFCD